MRRLKNHSESGFTLIELLLTTTMLTIIIGSLSAALIVFLSTSTETLERDDHSSGAGIFSSYFDRDVASADEVAINSSAGSTCSGSPNVALLSWHEHSASSVDPLPRPLGDPYQSAYVIVADPISKAPGGGTRYQLERVHCRGVTVLDRSTLVPNLPDASTKVIARLLDKPMLLSKGLTCRSNQALELELKSYLNDSNPPYTFRACTKTRLTP